MIDENRSTIKSDSHSILETKLTTEDGLGVRYCMLAFGQSPDGMLINCMYVLFKMDFELAKEKKTFFGNIKRKVLSTIEHLKEIFGISSPESSTDFFRIKALRGLQNEGHIEKINFVDS